MKRYAALIVDIVNSRKYRIDVRNEIQDYLIRVIDSLNLIFRNALEKKVEFSAGDEIQGLFSSVEASYLYFRMLSMLVSPLEVRAGIGVGEWDVVVKNAGTTSQDGRVYHNARYAIDAVKETLGYSVLLYSGKETDLIVNSLFNSTALIINKQSKYQNEIMLLTELLYPINAYEIINTFKLREILELIRLKEPILGYLYFSTAVGMNSLRRESLFSKIDCDSIETESRPLDAIYDSESFFVAEGKIKGLSTQIADLIGVSRQSIEKTIKIGGIYEARNLAITTLKYLKSIGDEI